MDRCLSQLLPSKQGVPEEQDEPWNFVSACLRALEENDSQKVFTVPYRCVHLSCWTIFEQNLKSMAQMIERENL